MIAERERPENTSILVLGYNKERQLDIINRVRSFGATDILPADTNLDKLVSRMKRSFLRKGRVDNGPGVVFVDVSNQESSYLIEKVREMPEINHPMSYAVGPGTEKTITRAIKAD